MPGIRLADAKAPPGAFSERRMFADRVIDPGTFGDRITLGTPRKACEATVFIDGVRQRAITTGDIDVLVDVQEIRTIELYRSGWEVPP